MFLYNNITYTQFDLKLQCFLIFANTTTPMQIARIPDQLFNKLSDLSNDPNLAV